MLYISMETGPATLSPVAEVEPCSTSAFWSRRPPATPCDSTATGRGAVVGRWSLRFWYCESALTNSHENSIPGVLKDTVELFIYYQVRSCPS